MILSRATLLLLLLVFGLVVAVCLVMVNDRLRQAEALAARLRSINAGPTRTETTSGKQLNGLTRFAANLGLTLLRQHLVPVKTRREAEMLLAGINLRGETMVAAFIGFKVLLLCLLPLLGWEAATIAGQSSHVILMVAVAGACIALVAPDMLLARRRRRRIAAIDRGLPDALDLLVICVDAGLSFEPALERVTREIASAHPEVAEEFAITANELRIAPDRRAVLTEMGARVDVDYMRRLAATLVQALQIGAPLTRALRVLANELRQDQMIRFEARAARLPVMLTLPMVAFIMPTVLLVVGGPAAVQLMRLH